MIKVYTYERCDTCRKAIQFLDKHDARYQVVPIREVPPSKRELKEMLRTLGGNLKRLFNVSGNDYRDMELSKRLSDMSEDEAVDLLSKNGNLVKRPFLIGPGIRLIGFDPDRWEPHI